MPEFYQLSARESMQKLGTGEKGLSDKEAEKRLVEFGRNALVKKEEFIAFNILANQFKSPLILILIIAAVVSYLLNEMIDAYAIIVILILNAALGFYQEYKAEKAIALLKKMAVPKAVVMRAERQLEISSEELVPGDIVLLEEGDKISADVRIIEEKELLVDESVLTGESLPAAKHQLPIHNITSLADRKNMLYSGTAVVGGRCRGVVIATGMRTEFGKIAEMIEIPEGETPLHKKFSALGGNLGLLASAVCVLIVIIGLLKSMGLFEIILVAIALAVAAIPEGLPAVVTICLALGTQRMLARNALVRRLHSIETLGSVTVICTDKTGTITKNEMTVTDIWVSGKRVKVTGKGYDTKGKFMEGGKELDARKSKELMVLLDIGSSCNNASLPSIGDPTEIALLVASAKAGIEKRKKADEIPFSSERKWMATVHAIGGRQVIYVKGAAERVLARCSRMMENGRIRKLEEVDKKRIMQENERMASGALRVLAFAYSEERFGGDKIEGLIFVGLAGMIDPPRHEIKDAVEVCRKAGIRVIMITGDHKTTAIAVARQIGLSGGAVEGIELDRIDDARMRELVRDVNIFTRVDPAHKVKILNALKARGEIVAMTGDGINDAPALKRADVGIAMGIKGTDVSREASDIVLRDDNFASIVAAVGEGRAIYDNIVKFVKYLVSANVGEIGVIAAAILIGFTPLLPLQILWINLVTDGLPALALSMEPAENVMRRKPRDPKQGIMHGMWSSMLVAGVVMVLASLLCFWMYGNTGKERTAVFTLVVFFELFLVFSFKSEQPTLKTWGTNKWLIAAVFVSAALQVAIIYTPAAIIFDAAPLGAWDWAVILALSSSGMLVFEAIKAAVKKGR
jgi:Ca2+-transporting ATPase